MDFTFREKEDVCSSRLESVPVAEQRLNELKASLDKQRCFYQ